MTEGRSSFFLGSSKRQESTLAEVHLSSGLSSSTQFDSPFASSGHVLMRPITCSISLEWRQQILHHLIEALGLPLLRHPTHLASLSSDCTFPFTSQKSFTLSTQPPVYQLSSLGIGGSSSVSRVDTVYIDPIAHPSLLDKDIKTSDTSYFNLTATSSLEQQQIQPRTRLVISSISSDWRGICQSHPWRILDLCKEEPLRLRAVLDRIVINLDSGDLHAVLRLTDWLNLQDDQQPSSILRISSSQKSRGQLSRSLKSKSRYSPLCYWEHDPFVTKDERSGMARGTRATVPRLQSYPAVSQIPNFERPEVIFARYARQRAARSDPIPSTSTSLRWRQSPGLLDACIRILGMSITLSFEHRTRKRFQDPAERHSILHGTTSAESKTLGTFNPLWRISCATESEDESIYEPSQPPIEGLPLVAATFGTLKIRANAESMMEVMSDTSESNLSFSEIDMLVYITTKYSLNS